MTQYSIIGDEWLLNFDDYLFTAVALKQPTLVYSLDKHHFESLRLLIGQYGLKIWQEILRTKIKHREKQSMDKLISMKKISDKADIGKSSSLPKLKSKSMDKVCKEDSITNQKTAGKDMTKFLVNSVKIKTDRENSMSKDAKDMKHVSMRKGVTKVTDYVAKKEKLSQLFGLDAFKIENNSGE